ncbi:MAG: MotA/TolQ/ExbB proton channel family protein [Myxococcales bacterium]|nr:MotA/TolQ/ExbB proton channel family protein [Myxococcales bacterium]
MNYVEELMILLGKGGFVAIPLVMSAIVVWYCLGYRAYMLLLGSRRDVRSLIRAAQEGKISQPKGVLQRAAVAGVVLLQAPKKELPPFLDEVFGAISAELGQFSKLATALVQAAPLLGLLGTVTGMIETFDSLGSNTLISQTGGGVAGGISEALFSTQMGLVVAVPGLLIGRMLDRQQQIIEEKLTVMKDVLTQEVEV